MHVGFHELGDDIDVLIVSLLWRLGHVQHLDNILVVKEFEQTDLSHDTLCIDKILERLWHLLDSDFLVRDMVIGTTNDTVSAMADLLDILELFLDAESSS
jgi:hypothetical protein